MQRHRPQKTGQTSDIPGVPGGLIQPTLRISEHCSQIAVVVPEHCIEHSQLPMHRRCIAAALCTTTFQEACKLLQ